MPQSPNRPVALPWHQRIGHRIVAVAVLAAFVPIMILGLTIGVKFRRDLVQQAINSQIGLTGAIQNGVDSLLKSYERQLSILAADPDVQQMEDSGGRTRVADRQREAMYRFLDINPVFYSCFIYAADGTVTSIAFRNRYRGLDGRFIGKSILRSKRKGTETTREAFLQILQSGRPSFTGHVISASDQKMMLMMVPIHDFVDSARCIGVISCAVNLEGPEMKELIREYPLQGGDILQLVDQTGRMIACRGDGLPEGLVGVSLDFDRLQAQPTQPVEFTVGDRPYLGIVTRLPALNSYLIAAKPRSEILGFLHRILFDLALVLGIAFVLAIGFGYAISRPLAANVDRLLEGIRRVSDGVVSHRVVVEGEDEMAQACAAFNDMVATLEKNRLMDEVWTREWERK